MIQDISRPDVNGVPPKMKAVCEQTAKALEGLAPYLQVTTSDNLCSSVYIRGSYQAKEEWLYGILENSPYFLIRLSPKTRYYEEGQDISMEMVSGHGVAKMRKYTGTVEKVVAKLAAWVKVGVVQK